jgi:hypothetical protein
MKIKNGGNMKTIKVMAFAFIVFITLTSRLFPIIYGSVSGIVTDEDTGKGLPGVRVNLNGRSNSYSETDKEGKFAVKLLKPGKYSISFTPLFPHCCLTQGEIDIEPGKNVIFNASAKIGGTIRGKVLYSDTKKPFPGVSINAFARFAGMAKETSKDDGSYFLGVDNGRFCPSPDYCIEAKCNIPNIAYKVLLGVIVEKGKETKAEDILFDLNDSTGIEGFITSSLNGKPLNDIQISIHSQDKKYPGTNDDVDMGEVYTNSDGYYYIKNLEPGTYWINILPPIADEWSFDEFSFYCKEKYGIVVIIGKKTQVDSQLDIPYSAISENGEENE